MKSVLVGIAFGLLVSSAHCFPVQPAHASDDRAVVAAINKQTQVLERIVRALEKCK
jgi:hypothetical protein